jgi:hypothetical protein
VRREIALPSVTALAIVEVENSSNVADLLRAPIATLESFWALSARCFPVGLLSSSCDSVEVFVSFTHRHNKRRASLVAAQCAPSTGMDIAHSLMYVAAVIFVLRS